MRGREKVEVGRERVERREGRGWRGGKLSGKGRGSRTGDAAREGRERKGYRGSKEK